MGMDVHGYNPASKKGEYFRSSIWNWGPLWRLTSAIGVQRKIITSEEQDRGFYNDAEGVTDPDRCRALAAALIEVLDDPVKWNTAIQDSLAVQGEGAAGLDEMTQGLGALLGLLAKTAPGKVTGPPKANKPPGPDREHVRRFAEFLRDCGGFQIR